ncbi:MotA/TolQ/ExbB proton channel family protein [Arcobacter sp. FWKO B]|uniref:MotA/TolQ/ExbB proton channel family protein n=1 Tax=Arcobacter sp. FWKO B TaxID=2593672 RepID=UPI0018A4E557|nr:MotA/TolQ/ExbB proton channel family protein [Arcobacter sp. FWKO B]QOG11961.1 MotA/TolQ/ExbB proton channel family protein [Arcobacter sp. FWKO B]
MDLLAYIDRGGAIAYFLLILNIIGFSVIIWKAIVLYISKSNTKALALDILDTLKTSSQEPTIQNIESKINTKIQKIEFGLNSIKIIATISPLIGLLGTVIGILAAFDAISVAGLGDPSIFSSGISVALITTITGLIVAIPHYIAYNYFIGVLDSIEIHLKEEILARI